MNSAEYAFLFSWKIPLGNLIRLTLIGCLSARAGKVEAVGDLHSDSLAAKEIYAALGIGMPVGGIRHDGQRVTRMTIYYQPGKGAIPPALGKLDGLRLLRLHIVGITALPREIGNLKLLDTLDILSTNLGPTLPDEIGELQNLRVFKVVGSQLTALPSTMGKLKSVQVFDFRGNMICKVDDSLRNRILSISPNALLNQRTSDCTPTRVEPWNPESRGKEGRLKRSRADGRHAPSIARGALYFQPDNP